MLHVLGYRYPLGCFQDRVFKFLALDEVESSQIVAMAVGIRPFTELSTSPSAKNLKAECITSQFEQILGPTSGAGTGTTAPRGARAANRQEPKADPCKRDIAASELEPSCANHHVAG
jgi:hypothetical protein